MDASIILGILFTPPALRDDTPTASTRTLPGPAPLSAARARFDAHAPAPTLHRRRGPRFKQEVLVRLGIRPPLGAGASGLRVLCAAAPPRALAPAIKTASAAVQAIAHSRAPARQACLCGVCVCVCVCVFHKNPHPVQGATERGPAGRCPSPAMRRCAGPAPSRTRAAAMANAARATDSRRSKRPARTAVSRAQILRHRFRRSPRHELTVLPGSGRSWSGWSVSQSCTAPLCGTGSITYARSCNGQCGSCSGQSTRQDGCSGGGESSEETWSHISTSFGSQAHASFRLRPLVVRLVGVPVLQRTAMRGWRHHVHAQLRRSMRLVQWPVDQR
jgi:hypothetical protein